MTRQTSNKNVNRCSIRVVIQRNLRWKYRQVYQTTIEVIRTRMVLYFHNHVTKHRQHRMLETFDCEPMIDSTREESG